MTQGTAEFRSIEDKIVRYFDGDLTDQEGAELLHRASISPEIRELFDAHSSMRAMAQRAMLAVTIPPALEMKVLDNINQLAAAEQPRRKPFILWSNPLLRYGIAALLIGGIGYGVLSSGSNSGERVSEVKRSAASEVVNGTDRAFGTNGTHEVSAGGVKSADNLSGAGLLTAGSHSAHHAEYSGDLAKKFTPALTQRAPKSIAATSAAVVTPVTNNTSDAANAASTNIASKDHAKSSSASANTPNASSSNASSSIASTSPVSVANHPSSVTPANVSSANTSLINTPAVVNDGFIGLPVANVESRFIAGHSLDLASRQTLSSMHRIRPVDVEEAGGITNFELGLQTATGYTLPANALNVQPFAEARLTADYLLDESNVVGVHITRGFFQTLPGVTSTTTSSAVILRRNLSSELEYAEELFYGHRFLLSNNSGLAIEASAGIGLIPNGSTISVELGFKMPMSSHLMGAVGFSLSRIHSNAESLDQLLSSQLANSSDTPVILRGSNIRNTLNGRLEYGLAYRF